MHKDLVSLNMVKDIQITGNDVSLSIILTTPACPFRTKIENDARTALRLIPGIGNITINMGASVPNDGHNRGMLDLCVKNAIAVGSGKGGVGKSTVAVNLAVSLARSGAKVGLMDADIYGPNIPTMMGIASLPPSNGKKIIPAEAYGVKVISIGFMVKPGQAMIWRGPMLHSAIRQFLGEVEWGDLDYLVIDLPPGTGDASLALRNPSPYRRGHCHTSTGSLAGRCQPGSSHVQRHECSSAGSGGKYELSRASGWNQVGSIWQRRGRKTRKISRHSFPGIDTHAFRYQGWRR